MEKIYQINLSRTQVNGSFELKLEEDYHNLEFQLELEDRLRFKSYLIITDPGNIIRLQRLVSHGELRYMIGDSPGNTSAGGYPGPVPRGCWRCSFYCIYENFEELFEKDITVTLRIRGNVKETVPDVIGAELWTDYGREQNKLTLSRYNDTQSLSDESKWYAGDFHTHTRLSDGRCFVREAMKIAAGQKLDFYVTTEHNVIHTGFEATDELIIPGIEITTEFGHLNCFGIKERPEKLEEIFNNPSDKIKTETAVLAIMESNRERGYINSLNHPFLYPWSWEFDTPLALFDTIEIENDPTYNNAAVSNDLALKLFDLLWADGHRIYAVGGSDAHNLPEERYEGAVLPSIIGDPRTVVYSEELSAKAILNHVRSGHICVSRFITPEPVIILHFDGEKKEYSYLPGDRLTDECMVRPYTLEYTVRLSPLEDTLVCRLIVNGRPVQEQTVNAGTEQVHFTYHGEASSYQWIRVDIRNAKEEFIGVINPVYAGGKESLYHTYREIQALITGTELRQ